MARPRPACSPSCSSTEDETEKKALRAEVVVLNMGVARAIAHRYRQRGPGRGRPGPGRLRRPGEGGERLRPPHERDFLSYAVPTVTGEVKRYFRDFGWAVRPPRRVQELQGQIAKLSSRADPAAGSLPEADARSPHARRPATSSPSSRRWPPTARSRRPRSTYPSGRTAPPTLGDLMPTRSWTFAERRGPGRCSARPSGRSRPATDASSSCGSSEGWTQEQIAQDIGVTQMQVSRLLSRILKDLRAELA